MRFYRKLNIKNKLLFMFIVQMVLPIVLLGFFLIKNVENNMKSQALTLSQDMLKVLELRMIDFSRNTSAVSQDLLYDLELYDVLNDDRSDVFTYYNNVQNLENDLRTITLSDDYIQAIRVFDNEGDVHDYDQISGRQNNRNIPLENLYELAREVGGRPRWYIDYSSGEAVVYLTSVINDLNTFNEVGLMVITTNLQPMREEYASFTSNLFEEVILLDKDDNLVFTSGDKVREVEIPKDKTTGVFYLDKTKTQMISYRRNEELGWTLVTVISRDALLDEVNDFTKFAFMIFIPLAFLLSMFTIFEGMDMVDAIHQIVSGMKDVSKGKKKVNIHVERQDELGFLADSFNDMTSEIENLVDDIHSEQLTRKEVELKALQAQINPHFLYNTLETINWHAQLKGAPEISEMVTALSSIMEATIGRDNKLISLRDELNYIENYLSIMKFRYEGRLSIIKNVDPKVLGIKIPRLILQPIIENAINHGIGQKTKDREISIVIERRNQHVVIEISDTGKGMTEQQLEKLQKKLNDLETDKSIGLVNVNKRLKLFYGERYGIRVTSELDEFTKVTVVIPDVKLDEGDTYYV